MVLSRYTISHSGFYNKKRIELLNVTEKEAFILKIEGLILRNLLNSADKIEQREK